MELIQSGHPVSYSLLERFQARERAREVITDYRKKLFKKKLYLNRQTPISQGKSSPLAKLHYKPQLSLYFSNKLGITRYASSAGVVLVHTLLNIYNEYQINVYEETYGILRLIY
jgi:hypothetical protein